MSHRPIDRSWGGYRALSVTGFHIVSEWPCRQRSILAEFWTIVGDNSSSVVTISTWPSTFDRIG